VGALLGFLGGFGFLLLLSACGQRDADEPVQASNPTEAAAGLEQSFQNAPAQVRENVRLASEALRQAEYDQAILSLTAVREQSSLTLNQGMAIHGAVVTMESELIAAMQSGDPNAKRAYELLRALKRN
jgi:hypothetical protein